MAAGIFAAWQPRYAERGIATYPLGPDRVPALSNYNRVGLQASRQLALKFSDSDAFGFMCSKRNGVTVLDVDTPDERVLADALSWAGPTPVIVQSGSGKWHAWYKFNGERRRIRCWLDKPIDVLGDGGFVVAPPSRAANGNYRFVQGSLDDLDRLPVMRPPPEAEKAPGERIGQGKREQSLWRHLMGQAHHCDDIEALRDVAFTYAGECLDRDDGHRFTDAEIEAKVRSVWAKTDKGENWFGTGRKLVATHDEALRLMALGPDAFTLWQWLRLRRWRNEPFNVPDAMAEDMPNGRWPRRQFSAARKRLLDAGELVLVRRASSRHGAAVYRWP